MAKLYAEVYSDKGGRKSNKGGDGFVRVDLYRKNAKVGTLGLYEVNGLENGKEAYRVVWSPEGKAKPGTVEHGSCILDDTEGHAATITPACIVRNCSRFPEFGDFCDSHARQARRAMM